MGQRSKSSRQNLSAMSKVWLCLVSKALPLCILTGCSGVGKTTTALRLQQMKIDFVVLDADFFTIMPSETNEEWAAHVEQMQNI